jgi:hypothetical protein
MRIPALLATLLALAPAALAECPPDCVADGGPAATACFVAWSGISAMDETCVDGQACDIDGKVDGVCTLGLQGCINVPGLGACTPAGLSGPPTVTPSKDPTGRALAAALDALPPSTYGCTPPGLALPLKLSVAGIKPGKAHLTVTASSGGKRDRDKLRLACMPSTAQISFARDVQPIFTARCAITSCHTGPTAQASGQQSLDAGVAYADSVNARATTGKLLRVKPGSIRGSQVAHRILGQALPRGGAVMPLGCPGIPPAGGCLTPAETFTILSWIAEGAPNN